MARLVGIMANRRDRMAAIAHQERGVLASEVSDDQAVTGFGMGFYQGDEVLHKKRPRSPAGSGVDWGAVLSDVQTDCAILHARSPTVGDYRSENTHPFRMHSWLFAHTGTLGRFDGMKDALRGAIHDFLGRNIRGQTDSELFFHVVLSFLHDAGQLENPGVDGDKVAAALRSTVALVDRLSAELGAEPPAFNLLITNGRLMAGMSRGALLSYVERRGLHDPPPGIEPTAQDDPRTLRYVLFASGETPNEYVRVQESEVVVVDRDLVVESFS